MDMQVDSRRIKAEREKRAWSQEHLAKLAGLGLRTIQRIESTGAGSYESVSALAAVLGLDVADLRLSSTGLQPESSFGRIVDRLAARRYWVWAGLAFLVLLITPAQFSIWILMSKISLTLLLCLGFEFMVFVARRGTAGA